MVGQCLPYRIPYLIAPSRRKEASPIVVGFFSLVFVLEIEVASFTSVQCPCVTSRSSPLSVQRHIEHTCISRSLSSSWLGMTLFSASYLHKYGQ